MWIKIYRLKKKLQEARSELEIIQLAEKYTEGFFFCREKLECGKNTITKLGEWDTSYVIEVKSVKKVQEYYICCTESKELYIIKQRIAL